MAHLLETLKQLETATTQKSKLSLSTQVLSEIDSNEIFLSSYLKVSYTSLVKRSVPFFMLDSTPKSFDVNVHLYNDDNSEKKVAIFVAVAQPFDRVTENLERKILDSLVAYTVKSHFDLIVNDICVNDFQWRNGTYVIREGVNYE